MAETATINVRMEADTKHAFISFCDEVGVSASSLMNMFAKTVVRNQSVPFPITTRSVEAAGGRERYARLFPADERELDSMLSAAQQTPLHDCVPADQGFAAFERRMGWQRPPTPTRWNTRCSSRPTSWRTWP